MTSGRYILAAAGLAAAAVLGPAAAAQAAAPATATVSKAYSVEEAGYQASGTGWRFRYAQATVKLPSPALSPYAGGEGVSVQLRAADETVVLGVSATRAGPGWNAAVAVEQQFGQGGCANQAGCFADTNGNSPVFAAGDTVSFNAYYVPASGYLYYSATDSTSGQSFAGRFQTAGALFTSARIGLEFGVDPWTAGTGYTPPAAAQQLAGLTAIRFTSYNGTRGFIGGAKWTTSEVLATSTGTSTGIPVAAPSVPAANKAASFTVSAAAGPPTTASSR
ncbi:MAG TPA: hypothetical protein VGH88_04295 [Streptosporangiaceae bacterium]|jgi:hypothetical protein